MTYWNCIKHQCYLLFKQKMTIGFVCATIYYRLYSNLESIDLTPGTIFLMLIGWILFGAAAKYLERITIYQELSICAESKFIIHLNKKNIINTLPRLLRTFPVVYSLLYIINKIGHGVFLLLFAKSILILLIGIFLIGIICGLFQLISTTPAAIINKEGMWIKEYGLIPWKNIVAVGTYQLPAAPMAVIRIEILDNHIVYKNAYLSGKLKMFWAACFKYPPVLISNLTVTNDEVIIYAQQYLS